jgi:hypothetical protein
MALKFSMLFNHSRMNANAPYQANCTAAPSKQANGDKSWLGFGQEMTIKQEI